MGPKIKKNKVKNVHHVLFHEMASDRRSRAEMWTYRYHVSMCFSAFETKLNKTTIYLTSVETCTNLKHYIFSIVCYVLRYFNPCSYKTNNKSYRHAKNC